jgi:beta-lactam-binding protein with PASTA domain
MIVYGALDLIGALLCNQPGAAPIRWFAVGNGLAAWDTTAPTPVKATTGLVSEVFRAPLGPGDVTYNPATKGLTMQLNLGADDAVGPLREFGVFGGDASVRPGSGTLVNYKVHPVIQKAAGQTLDRQLVLSLSSATGLRPGAQDLVGELLSGAVSRGLAYVALGTGGPAASDTTATQLEAEGYRQPLDPTMVTYDHDAHAITVTALVEVDEAAFVVAEAGLFGGDSASGSPNSGFLAAYDHPTPIDKTLPVRLTETFHLALSTSSTATVPNVSGMTPAAAATALDAAGLGLGVTTPAPGAAGTSGTVATQSPAAGTSVPTDSLVDVTIVAPAVVVVPAVVGLPAAQATSALTAAGLTAGQTTSVASTAAPGTVLQSDPAAWTSVPAGTAVALSVATPLTTPVPDVRGRTVGAALVVLQQAGLTATPPPYSTQPSSATPGTVVAQSPTPATAAPLGTAVTLTLAAGWTVSVPTVTGMTPDAAAAALAAAAASLLTQTGLQAQPPGLALGSVTYSASTATLGTIIEQSPGAGGASPLYGTVSVVVAAAPTSVVPDVRGKLQPDATALLTAAGFTLGEVTARMSGQPVNTVLDQSPPPALTEPTGSPVSLIVASPVMLEVPLLIGLALDGAQEGATARGFTLATPVTQASSQTPGTVVAQQPAAYTTAPQGSALAVTLAAGVPSLLGLTVTSAQQALATVGLVLGAQTTQPSSSTPGTIISQDPAPNAAAPAGSSVSVVVATVPTVTVPNLNGDDQPAAQQACTALGLGFAVGPPQVVAGVNPGLVVAQSPAAGTSQPIGTVVTVTLSAAPPTAVVPNVVGQPLAQATATLRAAQLTLTQGPTVATTASAPGTVVTQTPAASTPVPVGSAVTVNLATQPAGMAVPVPELRNQTLQAAEAAARAVGLTVNATFVIGTPIGLVVAQNPAPPVTVPPGTAISVTVNTQVIIHPPPHIPPVILQ